MNEEVSSSCDHCCQYTQSRLRKHKLWSFASEFRFTVGMRRSKQCVSDSLTPRVCVLSCISRPLCLSVCHLAWLWRWLSAALCLSHWALTQQDGLTGRVQAQWITLPPTGRRWISDPPFRFLQNIVVCTFILFFFIPKKKRALPKNSKADRSLC